MPLIGVSTFNDTVVLNGNITGAGLPALLESHLREVENITGFAMMSNDVAEYNSSTSYKCKLITSKYGDEIIYARYGTGGPGFGATWTGLPVRNVFLTQSTEGIVWYPTNAYIVVAPSINGRIFRSSKVYGDLHVTFLYSGDDGYYHMGFMSFGGNNNHIYYNAPYMVGTRLQNNIFNSNAFGGATVHISIPNLVNARGLFYNEIDGFNFVLEDGTLSKCKNAPQLFVRVNKWTAAQVLSALTALSDWSNDPELPEEGYPLSLPAAAAFYEAVHKWWDSHNVSHTYTSGSAPIPDEPHPLGWNVTYF